MFSRERIVPRVIKFFDDRFYMARWRLFDKVVAAATRPDLFFIQIGSNDGSVRDPIYQFVRQHQWHGILVEPIKYYFDRLRANYAGIPHLIFENVAISDRMQTREFYRVQEGLRHVPQWCEGLGSFYKDVILKHQWAIPDIERLIVTERVQCIAFADLLRKHRVRQVDLLLIDTEGYDYEIIRQIDFQAITPAVLMYEHRHLKADERIACEKTLRDLGYSLAHRFANTLAWRKPGRSVT